MVKKKADIQPDHKEGATMRKAWKTRASRVVVGVAALATLGLIEAPGWAQTGTLDPPLEAVDESGNPVPTTQTQPSWDRALGGTRFAESLSITGVAIVDKTTGLVWSPEPDLLFEDWDTARSHCANKSSGVWNGWRLPAVYELSSLFFTEEENGFPKLALPASGPFDLSGGTDFWTAQTDAADSTKAWAILVGGGLDAPVRPEPKNILKDVWCVRGGSSGPPTY